MKRSQPRRDWTAAREKVEREGQCRVCRDSTVFNGPLECAHIIGREHDKDSPNGLLPDNDRHPHDAWFVRPDRIVPLCTKHHRMYDAHELDLLPALTIEEQAQAVFDAGGIELARRRTAPLAYRSEAA